MGKIIKFSIIALFMVSVLSSEHIHDNKCGYNFKTDTSCIFDVAVLPTSDRESRP